MDYLQLQYQTEKDYAAKILAAPKDSAARRQLFAEAYNKVIGEIIEKYNPGGGETHTNREVILALIKKNVPPNGSILDLGCGGGDLVLLLRQNGWQSFGLDVSAQSITKAKAKLAAINQTDIVSNCNILDYPANRQFDCLVLDNVIEHLPGDEVADVLNKCYQLLKPNGLIIVLTPHRFSGPHDVSQYFLPIGARAEGLHLQEYDFTELNTALVKAKLKTLSFCIHPKLAKKIGILPHLTTKAVTRNLALEKFFTHTFLHRLLKINRRLTSLITALFFPTVIIGRKET